MYEIELNNVPVKIWAKGVDPHAMKEIVNLSMLPFVFHHLAFMPDVHGGEVCKWDCYEGTKSNLSSCIQHPWEVQEQLSEQ